MKVILQKDVKGLGKAGAVVNAADGYARNYLLPKGLAVVASDGNISNLKQKEASAAKKKEKELLEAKELGSKVTKTEIILPVKVGEGGRLYGSITNKDIADFLEKKGLKVDRRKIELKETIKALGEYEVSVKLHPEVNVITKVKVVEG
jgi:large subunit ribosomal protein L9